jgi:uncharacterized membrane protein YsdA (DUF1294 family)
MSLTKQSAKRKRRRTAAPILGVAGLSLSLAGGASGAAAANIAARHADMSQEFIVAEEEVSDVSLATFYVFDKENAGPSRHSDRLACGCWTGTYYTSGNDAYPTPLRPVTQPHGHVPKHVPKSPRQARSGSATHLALGNALR